MKDQSLNNGYVMMIHFINNTNRVFGPFPTPAKALEIFETTFKIKLECSNKQRPVISRPMRILSGKFLSGIAYVQIETLERTELLKSKD